MFKNPYYVYGPEDKYVPAKLNAGDFLLKAISEFKDKVALINGATDEKLTYGEIAQEAMNLAVSLVKLGVRKNDVIAICTENRREFWSTMLGITCSGAISTTINMAFTKHELKSVMGIAKPKYVFCSPMAYKMQAENFRNLNYIKKIIVYGSEKYGNTLSYNDLAVTGPNGKNIHMEEFEAVEVDGQSDVMMIMYSSGTTGLPKGVMITHLNILAACASFVDQPFVSLTITPWYHSMGLVGSLLGFVKGKTSIYLPKFEVDVYLRAIEKYKVSQLTVVPAVLVALCKSPSAYDVSSVLLVFSGAAPLHKETEAAVRKRFPNAYAVLQGYGMTEATLAVTLNSNPDKEGSVGLVNSNTIVKIVHPETRKVLGPNQEGEICVKGVMIMKGYIGRKRQDDFDEEGFFKTGDIGYFDEDKYLYIVDRLKELIKYKANQVAPAEIEAVLLQHESVLDVGVVGAPHPTAGEVPIAFVVLHPEAKATEVELQEFVAKNLSNPKHLRGGVRFVSSIPKTSTGKILRKELRKMVKNGKFSTLEPSIICLRYATCPLELQLANPLAYVDFYCSSTDLLILNEILEKSRLFMKMLKNPNYVYGEQDLIISADSNYGAFMLNILWKRKEKISLINGPTNETLTSGTIAQEAMNLAVSLTNLGVKKGEVIAICSENRNEFWGTVIGVACTGAVVTTINPAYGKDELKHVLGISKPKYLFCSPYTYKVCGETIKSYSQVKKVFLFGEEEHKGTILYKHLAIAESRLLPKNINYEEFTAVEVQETDTLFILYSSGTTGLPKGVMLCHKNLIALCCLEPTVNPDKVNLFVSPWFHAMGLVGTLRGLTTGSQNIYMTKFEIDTYLKIIEQYKVNQLTLVPPILIALCKYQTSHDVNSVEVIYSGAAPLHSDTISAVHKRFPNLQAVLQGYGMTETTLAIIRDTYNLAHLAKPGGVGYIIKNIIIKVVDPESRKPLGPNQRGEICVKGVIVMKGYIGKDRKHDFDEEGFFKTGDIGYYDEDKYFYIVDRLKELIKYKGYQVPPMELEAVLLQHPGVRDAGVVGLPHAAAGEVPLAFVVPQNGASLTESELKQFVAERLSNPKHLRGGVRFVKEIPKNPSGKILRKLLREMVKTSSKL
ncbi:uncharacterized protein [Battus philenor]|uniref:uncharacterized protein n=1 Tax=Battus philenor TaxID=42288 RepID=UPI0035D00518